MLLRRAVFTARTYRPSRACAIRGAGVRQDPNTQSSCPRAGALLVAGPTTARRRGGVRLWDPGRAMSRENVEIVRAVYDAVARRDAATVLALYDPDVELDGSRLPESHLGSQTHPLRGHQGLRELHREWNEAWENAEDHCEELIDAGEHVVSVVTRRGRGLASGIEVETRRGGVWTIRDGKVIRTVWFPSVEEALEAVGIRE